MSWDSGKESTRHAGDMGSIPGSGRSPGGGNGDPLRYSGLENPVDGGALWATVHGVADSQMLLSSCTWESVSAVGALRTIRKTGETICHER